MWKPIEGDDESRMPFFIHKVQLTLTRYSSLGTTHLQADFSSGEDEISILLTRHVADAGRSTDYISLHVKIEDHLILSDSSTNLQSLSSQVRLMNVTQSAMLTKSQCGYTNSTQVLVSAPCVVQT